MAITKGTGTAVLSGVTTTQTSSAIATTGDYVDTIFASLVVVGTPTGSASFVINESPDGGTTYYAGPTYNAALVAGTYNWKIQLDPTTTKVTITFTAQAGGTSGTFTAQLNNVTAI